MNHKVEKKDKQKEPKMKMTATQKARILKAVLEDILLGDLDGTERANIDNQYESYRKEVVRAAKKDSATKYANKMKREKRATIHFSKMSDFEGMVILADKLKGLGHPSYYSTTAGLNSFSMPYQVAYESAIDNAIKTELGM